MGSLSKMIKDKNKAYGELSSEKVKVLCRMAGVSYRRPEQAQSLQSDLFDNGYYLKVLKISVPDSHVGQTIVLRDLDNTFIRGYRIWIDFNDDYNVKTADLFSDEDLEVFGGH